MADILSIQLMQELLEDQIFATDSTPFKPQSLTNKILRRVPFLAGPIVAGGLLLHAAPAAAAETISPEPRNPRPEFFRFPWALQPNVQNGNFDLGEAFWDKSALNPALMFVDQLAGIDHSPTACSMFIQPGGNRAEWSQAVAVQRFRWYWLNLKTRVQNIKLTAIPGSNEQPAGAYATIRGGIELFRSPSVVEKTPDYVSISAIAFSGISNRLTVAGILGPAEDRSLACYDNVTLTSLSAAEARVQIKSQQLNRTQDPSR